MNGTRHNRNLHHLRRGCLAVLAGIALTANAQVSAPGMSADFYGRYVAPGMQEVTIGGQGRPIVFKSSPTISTPSGTALSASRALTLTNPSNLPIDVVAKTNIPPAALARVIKKGMQVVPVLGTGVALYELAKELGYGIEKIGGETVATQQATTNGCQGYPQTGYPNMTACGDWQPTPALPVVNNVSGVCYAQDYCQGPGAPTGPTYNYYLGPAGQPVVTNSPTTLDAIETTIAGKTTWPTGSKVANALRDAVLYEPQVFTPTDPVTLTGPATTPGSTTTTQNPDGTTTTSTVTHNHTYNDNKITTTTTTVNQTFNPTTNTTTTTTTTSTPPATPEEVPADDPCLKNPLRVGCQVLEQPPTEEVPTDTENVPFAPESVAWGAGASCPSPISIGSFAGAPRQLEFTPFCDTAVKMKPFFLAAAGIVSMLIVVAALRV